MINRINQTACTGCGNCVKTCPLDVFRLDTFQDNSSPCTNACPAEVDTRTNNYLIQQGRLLEAAQNFKKKQPFPAITGRVCYHPCEKDCHRSNVDTAVNINGLEQFMGDWDLAYPVSIPIRKHITKIAIVGSGPAGLSCAYFLAEKGYSVTIYEAMPKAGGMLRYGIPLYRLPESIVDGYIDRLLKMGVEFRYNTRVGSDGDLSIKEIKSRGFQSIMLAPGAAASKKINLEEVPSKEILYGLEFLKSIRSGEIARLSGTVLVVGGGDVAIDAAISAKRIGAAEVHVACLESCDEMPAYPHNIEDAANEKIIFHYGISPAKIIENEGKICALEFYECIQLFDDHGCFSPRCDLTKKSAIKADHIIFAVGQCSELDGFVSDVDVVDGKLKVASTTFAASQWGIFAAGDAVSGPSSVIHAITGGRECAESIDRMLKGEDIEGARMLKKDVLAEQNLPNVKLIKQLPRQLRCVKPKLIDEPFSEIREGFGLEEGFAEALRCMTCGSKAKIAYTDDCMTCFLCELNCPNNAIFVHPFKERFTRTLDLIEII